MSNFDLSSIPELLNDALFGGGNLGAAQLVCSGVLIMVALLPMMMTKQRPNVMIAVMGVVILMSAAIGWIGDSVVIVLILVIAGTLAMAGARWMSG